MCYNLCQRQCYHDFIRPLSERSPFVSTAAVQRSRGYAEASASALFSLPGGRAALRRWPSKPKADHDASSGQGPVVHYHDCLFDSFTLFTSSATMFKMSIFQGYRAGLVGEDGDLAFQFCILRYDWRPVLVFIQLSGRGARSVARRSCRFGN
jgi:hypothetical protein